MAPVILVVAVGATKAQCKELVMTQTQQKTQKGTAHNTLLALTAAATALPGINANAQQIAEDFQFGVRHHIYEEDANAADKTLTPVLDRYDIDVNQFRLVAPINDSVQFNVDYQHETMSGASPWYTFQLPGEAPKQVMSGASIEDTRTDLSAAVKYAWDRKSITVGVSTSEEDDYDSLSGSIGFSLESADRLATYSISADVSNDDINPVDADIFTTRPISEQSKRSSSYLFSYSQILNKEAVVKVSIGHSRKSGYLSDPYKLVFVNNNLIADNRPDSRKANTLAAQLRYFSDKLDGAAHADVRLYDDDWGIRSVTYDFAWYQNLGNGFQLKPSLRLYSQTAADFYQTYYTQARTDGIYSTDYRLSEYGAITCGVKLSKSFESWTLHLTAQQYESGGNKVLADAELGNPGLLDFQLFSLGVDFRF